MVESVDLDVVVRVLLDDASGVLVRVERVHENERDVDLVLRVEMLHHQNRNRNRNQLRASIVRKTRENETHLNLANTQVEESHSLANFDDTLGSHASHRRSQSSVELEDRELVKERGVLAVGESGVRDDLVGVGRLDLVPVAVKKKGRMCQC